MTKTSHIKFSSNLLWSAASLALLSALPMSQAAAQDKTKADSKDDNVSELIVTAQKREQRLKDVPIVVTTLSGKLLQNAGVHDIRELTILTPGLTVTSTSNESIVTARIRGVGTVGDNPGLESSVGVVIDGVYRARNGVGFGDLGEMERIEVIKGPQGTLFGKNTSAGVINVSTKAPSFKFGMDAELTGGNFGAQGEAFGITGPLVADQVAGRLYVAHRERNGFLNINKGIGPRTTLKDQDQNFTTARGQLLAIPNADSSIRIIADYTHRNENCCSAVQFRIGPTAAIVNALSGGNGVATTANPSARLAYANRSTAQVITDGGVSAEGKFKIAGLGTLTSITAVRDWKTTNAQDIDFTGADILYRNGDGNYMTRIKNYSQEFRLAGSTDKLNWIVGTFLAAEDLTHTDSYNYGSSYETYLSLILSGGTNPGLVSALSAKAPGTTFAPGLDVTDNYQTKSKYWAIFTNDNWKLSDAFEVTMGLRYTSENKQVDAMYKNLDGGAALAALTQFGISKAQFAGGGLAAITNPTWKALFTSGAASTVVGTLDQPWANPAFNGLVRHEGKTASKATGTFKAAYRWSPELMTYASYAKGYKAGGFNLDRTQTATAAGIAPDASLYFLPETVDSYELGAKTSLFGDKLLFNLAAYDQKFHNFQLNTFLGTAFVVESIPEVRSKGIDADIYWATPIKGLGFQGGVNLADTKYSTFTAAQLLNSTHFPGISLLPGNTISFAPKTSATAALTWAGLMGDLKGSWNLSAKYTSKYNTGSDLIPFKEQQAFTLVNARLGIGAPNSSWTFELWGQNLSNVTYKQVAFNGPLQGSGFQSTVQAGGSNPGTYYNSALDSNTYDAFMGAPRTYGVTLRLKY